MIRDKRHLVQAANGTCRLSHSSSHLACRTNKPQPPKPRFDNIPDILKALPQWVLWRYALKNGRWTKIPVRASDYGTASSTDASTWAPYPQTLAAYARSRSVDGIGFVVTNHGPIVGVDLDHVLDDTGVVKPWITPIAELLNTYCEYSPSREGLRLFATGGLPPGRRKVCSIEAYTSSRFLTVTGNTFGDLKPVANRTSELAEFHAKYMCPKPKTTTSRQQYRPRVSGSTGPGREGNPLPDHDLVRAMLSSASGSRLRALWRGDWGGIYPSHSEADLALVSSLVWWTQGDTAQVDRLFRQSGLYRDKWNRDDYQERTISIAIG